jgi:metallo-beta-lactamase class B
MALSRNDALPLDGLAHILANERHLIGLAMRKWIALGISVAGIFLAGPAWSGGTDDPLLRPIAPNSSKRWLTPQEPSRLFGQTYLVGFGGLSVALIRTSAGLILIDGAVPQAVPDIEAHIAMLGFSIKQVKLILSSEPHFDHASGIPALARDSGATVVASAAGAAVLRTGGGDPNDPQAAWLKRFPPVAKLRTVRNGEAIRLGDTVITARATPGHTMGSMSWNWRSCEERRCKTVVFASSLNPVAADGWRFSDPAHRPFVTALRNSFAKVRAMPCDILISAHPDQASAPQSGSDTGACRRYTERPAAALEQKLRDEAKRP